MKEMNYIQNNFFPNHVTIKTIVGQKNYNGQKKRPFGVFVCEKCQIDTQQFYTEEDLYQAIERNPFNNRIFLSYWVKCPKCNYYNYMGGLQNEDSINK